MSVTLDTSHVETSLLNAEADRNTAESTTTTTKEHKRAKNKVRVCETKEIVKFEGGAKIEKKRTFWKNVLWGERRNKKDELKYVLSDMLVTLDTSHVETSLLNAEAC